RKITPQTKALIPVHYGGHACDLDALRDIAEPRGIAIVEDAAHACGSEYKGRKVGGLGPLTCFSFHAVKNLACGDGGMITTTDGAIAGRLRKLRWLGIDADTWKRASGKAYSWYYEIDELGWKYHMNDITAAIGLVQLSKLDRGNARRREVAARYSESFADLDWIETPVE
ncbi:DegT/DnrJ/EryC1/StrS aminotransferase family protein, partial [bacterium]|nr:DegT/DnrJ/EryC1/StrS aminotransferase family protein [bacterium]